MKINNLAQLELEKLKLKSKSSLSMDLLKNDIRLLKNEFKPLELLNKASAVFVPATLRRSPLLNGPINFIARALFKEPEDVVSPASDRGTGNQVRNIALGVLETTVTYFLGKFISNKVSGILRKK